MASKFAGVINNLPRMLGTEPAYQEKVEAVKAQIKAEPDFSPVSSSLAKRYRALRGDEKSVTLVSEERMEALIAEFGKEGIEAILSAINMRLEAVSQLMIASFEAEDITSSKSMSEGWTVRVQYEPYAQVTDKQKFYDWCVTPVKKGGAGLSRSMTLPWQTTNSITKERLLNGEPEPPGVTAHAKTKIVLTKG